MDSSPRLDGIQVLRGLAAMMVAMGHYHGTAAARGFELKVFDQIALAAVGVDVFFVISGFIMELTTRPPTPAAAATKDFLARRAIRLLPLYWALTILAFLFAKLPFAGVNAQHSWPALWHSMLLLPYAGPQGTATYLISVAWSLTYEAYFYGLFALLLCLAPLQRIALLFAGFLLSILAGLAVQPSSPLLRMAADPMLLEFLAGCVLGYAFKRGWKLPWWASIACISVTLGWLCNILKFTVPEGERIFWWGIPAWLLVAGVALAQVRSWPQLLRPLVALGDVSYALYLTHFFTLALFVRLYKHWSASMPVSPVLAMLAFMLLSVAVSSLCYRLIEIPSRTVLSSAWRRRQAAALPG